MSMYNTSMRAYRALLSKEMQMAAWTEIPFWQGFLGFIGNEEGRYPRSVGVGAARTKNLRPTGKPIEVLTNFEHEGSQTMDIPVVYPLTEEAIYGDAQLLGTEEQRKIAYATCVINQVRKGVKVRDGLMGEQTLKKPEVQRELMENAQTELTDFNVRWNSYAPYDAFLRKYSRNIVGSYAGSLGYTQASHPNFFVMGYTGGVSSGWQITFSNTAATYETNVATGLAALQDGTDFYFSTTTIEKAIFAASNLKIRKIKFGKKEYYAMVINSAQAYQLWQDTKWKEAQQYANVRDPELNNLFSGMIEGIYRGVVIFVDQNIPGAKDSTRTGYDATIGTVNYGNANPLANPIDTSPLKVGILFGASAIVCGYASPLKFEQETWDYQNKKTEGSHMIVGYQRADIYDYDGYFGTANNFKENTSSLVVATYSPTV